MLDPTALDLLPFARSPMQEAAILLGADSLHDAFSREERAVLRSAACWPLWARPLRRLPDAPPPRLPPGHGTWGGQIPPVSPWSYAVYLGGRGSGKSTAATCWALARARANPRERIAVVAATSADVWQNCGEALREWAPPGFTLKPEVSKRRIRCPNGAIFRMFSADEPNRFRGWNHTAAWCDDLTAWKSPSAAFRQLELTLRTGALPQCFVTATPQPIGVLLRLVQDPTACVLRGTSYDNAAHLSPGFFAAVVKPLEGTDLGRAEVMGELLDQRADALFKREWFIHVNAAPKLRRIGIGLDPAETSRRRADDSGIVAAGVGEDGSGYVLADRTLHDTPDTVARAAVALYWDVGASFIVIDVGRNGEAFTSMIKMVDSRVRCVIKGGRVTKEAVAAPVSAMYQSKKIRHLPGLEALEDQLCNWGPTADWSPDRLDACCMVLRELMGGAQHGCPHSSARDCLGGRPMPSPRSF